MKLSPSGASVTTSKPRQTAPPPIRTKNKGWTKHAALRNRAFLWSVVPEQLSGFGFSITHTVRHCDSPQIWQKWIKRYIDIVRKRWPLTRYHIVTEWQRRGMPHLHGTLYFHGRPEADADAVRGAPTGSGPNGSIIEGIDIPSELALIRIWLKITEEGQSARVSQDVKPISTEDATHWLQYLAKHAVRGVSNYQRSAENIPAKWKGETGRVWRKGGDWPIETPLKAHGLSKSDEYQYRRIFCRYLASLPPSMRIKRSERANVRLFWSKWLKCNDTARSHLRAPSSFIRIEDQIRIIHSINPDAYFSDAVTGEVFFNADDIPVTRCPNWTNPEYHRPEADMSDLLPPQSMN